MLGKTNITALQEGAIVTDVADYVWIQQQIGINGNFVRTIFNNQYLVGITENGIIAYTADGEVWQTVVPDYVDIRLNDIAWDGNRFLVAGSCRNEDEDTKKDYPRIPLLLSIADFAKHEPINIISSLDPLIPNPYGDDLAPTIRYMGDILAIYPENNKYVILALGQKSLSTFYLFYTDLSSFCEKDEYPQVSTIAYPFSIAKSSYGMIMGYASYRGSIYKPEKDGLKRVLENNVSNRLYVFESKDEFYYMGLTESHKYELRKILSTLETTLISSNINWMFSDGVYYNGCQLFINNHSMLIVKKGESIGEKTLDDLVEIAPEATMTFIEKAFGQLFIFGNQGLILKSTNEVNNKEAITVQHLSAKQALAQSKIYTDEQVTSLEARIAALEAFHQAETTE